MKVLIVGSNNNSAIERFYLMYLKELGVSVDLYPAADIVFDKLSRNILTRALFKTKLITWYNQVNDGFLDHVHKTSPDLIWIFKGMEIFPKTLKKLRNKKVRLANYNPDHPFIIAGRGSGNSNVTNSVGLYDLHFCYSKSLVKEIGEHYHIRSVFLPFSFEHTDVKYIEPELITEINHICFQGNPDQHRVKKIEFIANNGFEIHVYGIGWHRTTLAKNNKVRIFPIASRTEFWRKNQEYRIQLNLFREHNIGSHNMRTFEIPAVGGIQLSPYSQEQASFFAEHDEIFFFRNDNDLLASIDRILKLDRHAVNQIRSAARRRAIESGYSFRDRAQIVFNEFKKIL